MTDAEQPETSPGHALVGTTVATVVIAACGVITGIIAARSLGPEGRGQLATMTVWASSLLHAAAFGLPEAVAYFSAADPASRDRVWTTGQVGAIALGAVVMFVGSWLIPGLFSADETVLAESVRWYVLLCAIPSLGALCAWAWLQGRGGLTAFNVSRSSLPAINAAGFLMLWLAGDRSVVHYASVLLVGNVGTWLLAAGLGPMARILAAPPSIHVAKRLLHYGIRVQFRNWLSTVTLRLDQLVLSLFAATASLGLYVVAVNYANVLLTVPGSAALVMLPRIIRQHGQNGARTSLEDWYRRSLWTTLLAAAVMGLSSAFIVPAAFGSTFRSAVPLVVVLLPATVILGMNQILSTAFQGIGRPEIASKAELVGVVVTVLALAALLPRYGLYGAAIASLLAYGSIHLYMMREAIVVLGTNVKALCIPTRGDLAALRDTGLKVHQRLTAYASERSVKAHRL